MQEGNIREIAFWVSASRYEIDVNPSHYPSIIAAYQRMASAHFRTKPYFKASLPFPFYFIFLFRYDPDFVFLFQKSYTIALWRSYTR